MKTSSLFLSSLVAAAAMSSIPAFADDKTITSNETISDGASYDTVSVKDGATVTQDRGTATFKRLLLHTAQNNNQETYDLNGGVLNITGGTTVAAGSVVQDSAGLIIGHWGNQGGGNSLATVDVASGAVLNAVSGWTFLSWDTSSALNVNGEVNLYGITFSKGANYTPTATLTLSDGGRLNLGAGGFANENSNAGTDNVNLNGGTLGALDSWNASVGMSLGGNVKVDTTKWVSSDSGTGASDSANNGATITLSGNITQAADTTLTVSGAGTLALSGTSTLNGSVTVDSGASLDLSGGTLTLASAISNSGTVTVNSNTVFVLAEALKAENTYTLISGSGTINGWDASTLSLSNFRQEDGSIFTGRSTINVATTSGAVTITEGAAANLVWNGTSSSGNWDVQTTQNWTNDSSADYFYAKDNVTFNSSADQKTVTLADDAAISVGTMTVESGTYTFTPVTRASAFPSISGTTLTVASGATMNSDRVNLLFDDVVIAGTLSFDAEKAEAGTTLNWSKVTFQGGTFHIEDTQNTAGNFLTIGEVAMSGNGMITSHWSRQYGTTLAISKLSGSGDLSITGGTEEPINYSLGSIDSGYSGTISVAKGANKADVNLSVGAAAITGATSAKVAVGEGTTFSITGLGTAASSATVSGTGTIAVVGSVSSCTGNATQSHITLNNVSDTSKFTGVVELRNVQTVVSGNGASSFADASKVVLNNAALHFNNDKGTFSKDIEIGNGQNGYIRSYGNNTIANSKGATIDGNISGAGTLTANDGGDVTYNGTVNIGTYSATGISVFNGSSNTIGAMTVRGLTLGENATLNISGSSSVSGTGKLNVNDGGVLEWVGDSSATNQVGTTVNVNGGGTLKFSGHDLMGWESSPGTAANVVAVLASDSADKLARLDINDTGTMTFSRSITMNGNALISTSRDGGSKFNTFGGKITATGTNNTISDVEIQIRENFEIAVTGKDDELKITSAIVNHDEGGGGLTKTGLGTLILSNENSTLSRAITISEGPLVAGSASALGTGKTTVASGASLGLIAGTTVSSVSGGITLANGAKIIVDMASKASATETFMLELITGTVLTYNSTGITSDNVSTLLGAIELSNWNKDGWIQTLTFDDSANKLSLTMTIPEPSAFGLLAGVGALVFVAARRRRRAK